MMSDSLKHKKVQNHAAARSAKATIRRNVMNAIDLGEEPPLSVFDAFAGQGAMHAAVWREADRYVGCDIEGRDDGRELYIADNRRVLRAVDLAAFNIFDLDAYGSPWEQAIIIADRRKVRAGELLGIVLTDGSGLALRQGGLPIAIRELTGLKGRMPGLPRWQDDIIDRAVAGLARRMNCEVVKRWQAVGKTGASVRYIGLVLKGLGKPSSTGLTPASLRRRSATLSAA